MGEQAPNSGLMDEPLLGQGQNRSLNAASVDARRCAALRAELAGILVADFVR